MAPDGGLTISRALRAGVGWGAVETARAEWRRRVLTFAEQAVLASPLTIGRRPDDEQAFVALVVPAARRLVGGRQALALTGWAPRVCRHARERAHLALGQAVGRRDDGARVEAGRAVQTLGSGEHHGVKDWRRTGHAGGGLEGRAIEVPHPDADGHVAGIADGPVVVIRLRRAGLDGDRKGELQAAAPPENELARAVVGEHVGDPIRGERRDEQPARCGPLRGTRHPAGATTRSVRATHRHAQTSSRPPRARRGALRRCRASGRGRSRTASGRMWTGPRA